MTAPHSRLRRHGLDPAVVAARLELAADGMRAAQLEHGPVRRESIEEALENDRCAICGSVEHFREDCPTVPAPAPEAAPLPPVDGATPAPVPAFSNERRELCDSAETFTPSATPRLRGGLTWRSRHDERSRLFGVRARLAASAPLQDRVWPIGPVLDQGAEGECVGCGIVDAANSLGHSPALDLTAAAAVYARAQRLDDIPGEEYAGTSVLAGLKAGVEAGYFGGYLWAFGTRDIAQAILQRGPVVIGIPWLSGMYDTGPGGLVTVAGDDQGLGHCLLVYGLRMRGPQGQAGPWFCWQNSWGPDYGDQGTGWVHHRDLAALLHGSGEAAIPTREAQR